MAYTNLTAAQEKTLVDALKTQFMGMDEGALLRFADLVLGMANTASAAELADAVADLETYSENINTWAVALATKLNADAGVTDTNYDVNPQA